MKKNKLNKTIIGIGAFIVLGSSGIIAAACNSKKNNDEQIRVENNQKILSGKIKYLAIGDDYTAGNNYSKNNYVVNGFDEQTSQITGLSYASYLANAIKDLNDKKTSLTSYYNYGLSGSKLDDWLHILNPSKYPINTDIQNNIDYNKNLMNDDNSSRLQEQFGNFDEEAFNKIRNKIKEANLLTISVGFNDFFSDVDLFNNLFEITNSTTNYEDLETKLKSWSEKLVAKASAISQKYNALIKEILSVNPNAHINLVGYIGPYLKLANILKRQFNGKDYIYEAVKELNNLIKKVAKNNQINFVSFHDEESIIRNPDKFSLDIFEMLPSLAAYKKLAQDIFIKLALDPFKYDELISNANGDSDVSGFSQAILFEKKAEDIKQTILGITGDNTDNFINKKYSFENESQNSEILESQNSDQNANPLALLKAKFNNGKGLNAEKTASYFELTTKFLGLNVSKLKLSFAKLKKDLADEKNRQIFANFIDQILSSETLYENINETKTKSNEVIEKKSYANLEIKDIASVFKKVFLSPNSIYTFFKELSQTDFAKNPIIKNKFESYTELITKDLFASNLIKSFLPTEVSNNFETIFNSDEFHNSLKNVVNSFASHLIDEPDKYSSAKNYTEFINLLLKDSHTEIKEFIATIISSLKSNPELVETILSEISQKIQILYKLDENQLQQVKKFIKIFMLNLNDFKYTDKLTDFVLQTLIDLQNENPENKTIDKFFSSFFSSILVDKYDSDKKHILLFSLISSNLGKDPKEREEFQKGFEIFSLSYLAKQNLFDLNKLGKLVDEKNREDILRLLINLVKNENQELTEDGKKFITNFTTLVLENEIDNPNSNLNILLKQLSSYFIVNPVSLGLKTIFGEDIKISNESVENFVEGIWDKLWSQIKSKEIVDNLKKFILSTLNKDSHYDTNSTYNFITSILKNAKSNGIIGLVDSLFKKILGSNEIVGNVVDGTLSLLEQGAKTTFTKEKKQLASSYFTSLLTNIPKSKLYDFAKAKLETTLANIDISKQKNFKELSTYVKDQMEELFGSQNESIVKEVLDIVLVNNGENKDKSSFSKAIQAFSLIFENDKVIEFIISKLNFKNTNEKAKDKFTSADRLKLIIQETVKYPEIKTAFKNVIDDLTKIEITDDKKNNLGEIISLLITSSKDNLANLFDTVLIKIANDETIKKLLIDDLFKYLSINGDEEDKKFISELLKKIINRLKDNESKTNFFTKVFDSIAEKAKSFDVLNPSLLISQLLENLTSVVSLNDFGFLSDLLGEDENQINGSDIVKLINLFLGKSNNPDSIIYKSLANINMNENLEKRWNLNTLNEVIFPKKKSAPNSKITPVKLTKNFDPLDFLNKIFELLNKEIEKEANENSDYKTNYNTRYNKEAYKATYRFIVTLKLVIFEMFGRETLESNRDKGGLEIGLYSSTAAILWMLQEGLPAGSSIIANAFLSGKKIGMQNYFKNDNIRREFTNYVKSSESYFIIGTTYTYFNEGDYDPSSIDYLIVTSGYNSKDPKLSEQNNHNLTKFKYKISEDSKEYSISKKDYILLTIKEGGFAKFMKLNNKNSGSSWSGLDKVDFMNMKKS
ncbi:hypothetical protein DA803_01740 [[Mycoplasma] phocae]|uniref:Uncharacterized protein n=1 Tax=[Mycoplasma] phocae TaxID=142651 RepID=A0A2Z5IRB5_9BACT|nr:GDSL-type esterase/lipase family protein [[Mycoplasma] phocae]AXE60806.1 hypothetical protein DA803_01740 [[Mycoplasma] phocae]